MKVLSAVKQLEVLSFLMEGGSLSGASRFVSAHRGTCTRLMVRFGEACGRFLDQEMRDLTFEHVQLDEIWTFCAKKDRTIGLDQMKGIESPEHSGSYYLYTALDEATQLIPSFRLAKRGDRETVLFLEDLWSRLKKQRAHDSDCHAYKLGDYRPIIRISTDGYEPYPQAVHEVFGPYATHGVLIKKISKDQETKEKKLTIDKRSYGQQIDPQKITTSLVEPSNLTSRTFMKRFTRKTCCFSKKLENLKAAIAIHMAAYNYCWKIKTLKTTPAVAAALAGKPWSHADLYDHLRDRWPELFFLESSRMSA